MLGLLWLVPALPLASFLALALLGARLPRRAIAALGVGSVGASAFVALLVAAAFLAGLPGRAAHTQALWTWLDVAGFRPAIGLYLDALSLLMVLVVTGVGFLIHLYSTAYMAGEAGYSRFFAAMNLFVASMLILVLADNLLLLYLGWEGVGLCSYLLIGFWYEDPSNVRAANKAFIVTRVGDTAMAIGLFLLFASLGTLDIQELMRRAQQSWPVGAPVALAAAALLLGGAVGKSGQLPLQTWLPDAMAGPTPVSALIHAATMVTAGVYLIARTNVLFTLAPAVQAAVAVVGALTLLLAGFSALAQTDIKRALAYSTISQIGYMFLALGVGAWSAAMFHFMTHAFFKALLFLAAGVVILRLHHEQNMFRMGGLRRAMPLAFWTFLAGAASLAALPLVTAGFYSKDAILWAAWASELGGPLLWGAGVAGALLTGLYTFRMVFLTFFGPQSEQVRHAAPFAPAGWAMGLPLVVLAALSLAGGLVELPTTMGAFHPLSDLLHTALPEAHLEHGAPGLELALQFVAALAALVGVAAAYLLYQRRPALAAALARSPAGDALRRLWLAGWGFDWLYERIFVRPFVWLARANQGDAIDLLYAGIARLSTAVHGALSGTQTGQTRQYAMGIVVGAVLAIAIVVLL
ncbi:MAG TPA: NADH-quinone oxidoreductase subunit L [Roseiflexaceae bacterium]|nr:NADH-quinone oxidoreductase subunit L [Roseiflexaceae bacterium]